MTHTTRTYDHARGQWREERDCAGCGGTFTTVGWRVGWLTQSGAKFATTANSRTPDSHRYCSRDCASAHIHREEQPR